MAPPARLERATPGLGNRCSIHLSYGGAEREATELVQRSPRGRRRTAKHGQCVWVRFVTFGVFWFPPEHRILNRLGPRADPNDDAPPERGASKRIVATRLRLPASSEYREPQRPAAEEHGGARLGNHLRAPVAQVDRAPVS